MSNAQSIASLLFGTILALFYMWVAKRSVPQASQDLQRFQQLNPHAMRYDLSRKCYVRAVLPEERRR